uniref:Uncharacterized protein n=1 Tax=Anguilla anguilla TaxID=7936 RepID=A0A0E9V2R4_ANGAN
MPLWTLFGSCQYRDVGLKRHS